ncbi:hypothetical protein BG452_19420 [Streptomyces sp. CBMA123]|nr:hypothetical protein [Streptomyces sp. CBMA123]
MRVSAFRSRGSPRPLSGRGDSCWGAGAGVSCRWCGGSSSGRWKIRLSGSAASNRADATASWRGIRQRRSSAQTGAPGWPALIRWRAWSTIQPTARVAATVASTVISGQGTGDLLGVGEAGEPYDTGA